MLCAQCGNPMEKINQYGYKCKNNTCIQKDIIAINNIELDNYLYRWHYKTLLLLYGGLLLLIITTNGINWITTYIYVGLAFILSLICYLFKKF